MESMTDEADEQRAERLARESFASWRQTMIPWEAKIIPQSADETFIVGYHNGYLAGLAAGRKEREKNDG